MGWLGFRKKTRKPLLNRKLLVVGMLVVWLGVRGKARKPLINRERLVVVVLEGWLGVREKRKKDTFKSRTIGGGGVGGVARR